MKLTKSALKEMIREELNELTQTGFSSKEARAIMDKSVREYAQILRKAEHKIIDRFRSYFGGKKGKAGRRK